MSKIAVSPGAPNREPVRGSVKASAVSDGVPEGAGAPPGLCGTTPIIRWAGGKGWLAPQVIDNFRAYLDSDGRANYVEPFLGGGAVALGLAHHRVMYLSDACQPLIQMYKAVVASPERVYAEMREIASRGVDKDTYFAERRRPLTPGRFLYLNHLSFNGLYRENKSGQYNVPFGDRGEDPFPTLTELHAIAAALRHASLQTWDFRRALRHVQPGWLVFADSPYAGGFAEYTKAGFTDSDQQQLAGMLESLAHSGVEIVACNRDTPAVRAWYSWAPEIVSTAELHQINSDGDGRKHKAGCLLVTTNPDLLRGLR